MNLSTTTTRYVPMALVLAALSLACAEEDPLNIQSGGTLKDGEKCASSSQCLTGLVCTGAGICKAAVSGAQGQGKTGDPCATYADCRRELTCPTTGASKYKCASPGTSRQGEDCLGPGSCAAGLLCSSQLKCQPPGGSGALDIGATCAADKECALGLVCVSKACTAPGFWSGMTQSGSCAKDEGTPRVFFEVPRTGKAVKEFYRLPFPNDVRLKGGKVDLTGHPSPEGVLPDPYGKVVGRLLKVIGEDVTGFGLNTAVFLRTSHAIYWPSVQLAHSDPTKVTLQFFNIDKKSAGYASGPGLNVYFDYSAGRYICQNWFAVRPRTGSPLDPKTTYAVLLRKGISEVGSDDKPARLLEADADFKVMLAAAEPSDADLKAAHAAYKPLRDFLQDRSIDPSTVIGAAVFTTMDPHRRLATFRQQVQDKAATPSAGGLTLCDGKAATKSPCDKGLNTTHVCPSSVSADFHELQGVFKTPVLQQGKAPFASDSDGGVIAYGQDGKPVIQGGYDLCYAVTVPKKATMPASGWPVVIYAHGTGGSFRSFIGDGTAAALASVSDPSDSTRSAGFLVVSTDAALHGPRGNTSEAPDALFFNIQNPRAARDNVYQGAADKFQLLRVIKTLQLDAASSPTGEALKIDPKKIYFFGHSQGTVEGIPFLAHEPEVPGAVLSGAGGFLVDSVLNKTKPVNVAGAVKLALGDPFPGSSHPLLNLLQLFFEEVDSVNYAGSLYYSPVSGVGPKHVFLSMGISDGYTPPATVKALAWAMHARLVKPEASRCGDGVCGAAETCKACAADCKACLTSAEGCGNGTCDTSKGEDCRTCPDDCALGGASCPPDFWTQDDPPVKGNHTAAAGAKVTAGVVQYVSDGSYDDHFVISKNKVARTQSSHFLGSAVWDSQGIPTIPKN